MNNEIKELKKKYGEDIDSKISIEVNNVISMFEKYYEDVQEEIINRLNEYYMKENNNYYILKKRLNCALENKIDELVEKLSKNNKK